MRKRFTLLFVLVLVVLTVAASSRSQKATIVGRVPGVGERLSPELQTRLAGRRTLVFVSDHCEVCRSRAEHYVRYLGSHSDHELIVSEDEVSPFFRERTSSIADRVVFIPENDFERLTGIRYVPTYVEVDASGQILSAGMSRIGWTVQAIDPADWVGAWKRLFRSLRS